MNVTALRDRDIIWADYVFITGMVIQKKSVDQIIERCKKLNVKIVAGRAAVYRVSRSLFEC